MNPPGNVFETVAERPDDIADMATLAQTGLELDIISPPSANLIRQTLPYVIILQHKFLELQEQYDNYAKYRFE